jgi:apolipoprotein N-acyltransferase
VHQPPLPLWAALVVAAGAGPVLDAGFPDKDIWPLAFVGIALVLTALIGRRVSSSLLVGFVAGESFYLVHISWATEFLGEVLPMLALVLLQSLFFALGAALVTLAYRWVPRVWPTLLGRIGLLPVVVGGLWAGREGIASVWPYGGFAWGRVALSQSMSPFADLLALVGVSGLSFVMVTLVAAMMEIARHSALRPLTRATVGVGAVTLALLVPAFPSVIDGHIRVLAVQGNGKAAYLDEREYGDLLRAQYEETERAATEALETGGVDVVLWPEGGTDVDPLRNEGAAAYFDRVSEQFDAPLVSGAITEDGDKIYNSSLLWEAGQGAVDMYNKRHPIPFGEYIPDRQFWRPFAPELIDLVEREYTIGTTDPIFDLGDVTVSVNICYDIVDDELMRESVTGGGRVVFAQSNNADFGHTDESLQQLAIARVRAIELGRSVVNISTVGTSAIILPDGRTLQQLPGFTAGSMLADVPTSSVVTPAVVIGRALELLVGLFGLGVLLVAAAMTRRRRG